MLIAQCSTAMTTSEEGNNHAETQPTPTTAIACTGPAFDVTSGKLQQWLDTICLQAYSCIALVDHKLMQNKRRAVQDMRLRPLLEMISTYTLYHSLPDCITACQT